MTNQRENSAEFQGNRSLPTGPATNPPADSAPINPYQAPAYHPDIGGDLALREITGPSIIFVVMSVGLIATGLLITVATQGLGLPLMLAAVGGTIRASAVFNRQKGSKHAQIPAEVLLITSSFVTLLLMFCCAIAFVTVCTGGVLATGGQSPASFQIWSLLSGIASLAAFIVMFVRSIKWAA